MSKQCVSVMAKFTKEGSISPISILWEDGRTFEIDRIIDKRRAASLKSGGIGIRYTCSIRGRQIYLFKEDDTWFVERP